MRLIWRRGDPGPRRPGVAPGAGRGRRWRGVVALALTLGAGSLRAAESAQALRLEACRGHRCVAAELPPELARSLVARGVSSEEWGRALAVRTEAAAASRPPGPTLFGRYTLRGTTLLFEPRLPFLPGDVYVATLSLTSLAEMVQGEAGPISAATAPGGGQLRFSLPVPRRAAPRVVAIHPDVERVPANLLRAYVEFSVPMRPDVAPVYLRLEDAAGEPVELAFVEIDGGLWDATRTRLTLLFHPGRIKRGVAPRETLGPPLAVGERYRLVIDAGWPAATGEPLVEGGRREWIVGAADREAVSPAGWTLTIPRIGTREALTVDFGEPLDHALAGRLIEVARFDAPEALAGTIRVAPDGGSWSFEPREAWVPADHVLRVQPELEDLAGNNLRGVFDRELGEVERTVEPAELGFRPASPD